MDGAQTLIRNGRLQNALDCNHQQLLNPDLSNFPPSGIPPTIVPPDSNWLNGWNADDQEWMYSQPRFADIAEDLTVQQQERIFRVGTLTGGTWRATPIANTYLPTLDGIRPPILSLSLNNQRITNLADPIADGDAVNRGFMDALLQGLNVKEAVRCATTNNISLGHVTEIDTVPLANGDRVLVKDQTQSYQNGIYVVDLSTTWSRATDCDSAAELLRAYCTVLEGDANIGTAWVQVSTDIDDPLGPDDTVTFLLFSAALNLEAGDGLDFTGRTLNVLGTTNRIDVGTNVDISSNYVGQSSITTLGTITTGTWHGTIIDPAHGGTGLDNDTNTIDLSCPFTVAVLGGSIGPALTFTVGGNTALTLPSAGTVATRNGIETLTNKRITKRSTTTPTSSSPTINTDNIELYAITALSANITSFTDNLTGTPAWGDILEIWIRDNGTERTISWGNKFLDSPDLLLPDKTNSTTWTYTRFEWNQSSLVWFLVEKVENLPSP